MDKLPEELRHQIALFVQAHSHHDLCSLSQTSRTWHDTTLPCRYHTLTIQFYEGDSPAKAVARLNDDRWGSPFFKYTRRLDLVCLADMRDGRVEFLDFKQPAASSAFVGDRLSKFCDTELTFLSKGIGQHQLEDWQPLVSLIAAIEHLEELHYMIINPFPPELTQAISQHHPRSRLNIWTHQLPKFDVPGFRHKMVLSDPPLDDRFATDVLQLPGLRTLGIHLPTKNGIHHDDILPFVGMAPNLKHLFISCDTSLTESRISEIKQAWESYYKPTPVACLHSLSFNFAAGLGPWEDILLKMTNVFNLSQLRSLDMCVDTDPGMLAQAAEFLPNLNRLYINMQRCDWDFANLATDSDDMEMIDAVCAFNPLEFLCLRDLGSVASLRQIFSKHGQSLKGLILEVFVDWNDPSPYNYPTFLDGGNLTRELADKCPNLQELRIPIQRRAGSSQECSIYKALGNSFPHVHTLMLDLKYDPRRWPVEPPEPVATCFRESVINAAMDKELALAIWDMISSSQPSRRLRNLRIRPFGSKLFSVQERHVLHHVSRSYLLTCSGPYCDRVGIEEIGRIAWVVWAQRNFSDSLHMPKKVKGVLDELWPLGPDKTNWRSMDWKSFPLAG